MKPYCSSQKFFFSLSLLVVWDHDQTSQGRILRDTDSSKLKELVDDNFTFDENGRRFSKKVENAVGKGEIARYEQFLLFPQCFQKTCNADM